MKSSDDSICPGSLHPQRATPIVLQLNSTTIWRFNVGKFAPLIVGELQVAIFGPTKKIGLLENER
jgi:hypothetical protein